MLYLYDFIKLFHFISAAILLLSICYSSRLWLSSNKSSNKSSNTISNRITLGRITTQTGAVIIPCALFQLITGFTLVSLKHHALPIHWVILCISGFMVAMTTWFLFIYGLFSNKIRPVFLSIVLLLCAMSLLFMVFLMSNVPV